MPALKFEVMQERREHIVGAAMRCFAREGYSRTSMREVAKEAGMTTGAIYVHFDGKEALLAALAEKFKAQRSEALEPESSLAAPAALASSLTALTDYLDTDEADGALRSDIVMLAEALDVQVLRDLLVKTDLEHFRAYERLLGRNLHWKRGVDVDTLSRVVTGAVFGLLILRAFHPKIDRKKYIACLERLVEGACEPSHRQQQKN